MERSLQIGTFCINDESDCYIVAEIGHNHQGSVAKAKELFRAAKECGADAVKLQKRDNRALYTQAFHDKPYENENSFGPTYGAHREALELGWEQYQELQAYARTLELDFFATAFDFASADFLAKLDVPAFKIASGDLKTTPLLRHVAQFQKPMLVSTGGAHMDDVRRAYEAVMPINPRLCIMQCTAGYPPAFEELNLRVLATFREAFPDIVIGLSAHDNGIAMALAGYMLGARVIEKHFTLDRAAKGTDHAFSLERPGLRRMSRDLRRLRVALGDGVKRPYPSEEAPLYKMGKKLVAAHHLEAGHRITRNDVAIKSPNDGLPAYELDRILGHVLNRSLGPDENLRWEDLQRDGD
jgi:N-acetylneuraminate synthase/sialic acid synthase